MPRSTAADTLKITLRPLRSCCELQVRPTEETIMPTFDGGHYFLTVLVPIRTAPEKDDAAATSPVHALRKRLGVLPSAAGGPGVGNSPSPFARSARTHFARFVIVDDVAYNGRDGRNVALVTLAGQDLTAAQPQDHLTCPFLLFSAEFDAHTGAGKERDSYLVELWNVMERDLRQIFRFCVGFDSRATDAASFAAYIAACQIETTMSFNDYYAEPPALPSWRTTAFRVGVFVSAGALAVGVAVTLVLLLAQLFAPSLQSGLRFAVELTLAGMAALVVILAAAYVSLSMAGARPFPAAPDSNLPTVLKALHLQREFTRLAIDNQLHAAGNDEASARALYDNFATFIAANRPGDLDGPTQAPGVIGI
jgi:hypothetical protein